MRFVSNNLLLSRPTKERSFEFILNLASLLRSLSVSFSVYERECNAYAPLANSLNKEGFFFSKKGGGSDAKKSPAETLEHAIMKSYNAREEKYY